MSVDFEVSEAWLTALRQIRRANGRPSLDEIEHRSGEPRPYLRKIFNGEVVPLPEELEKIVWAIDPEGERIDEILTLRALALKAQQTGSRTDGQLVADAIGDLADAITALAEAIREGTR